jgi:hypothetical protein
VLANPAPAELSCGGIELGSAAEAGGAETSERARPVKNILSQSFGTVSFWKLRFHPMRAQMSYAGQANRPELVYHPALKVFFERWKSAHKAAIWHPQSRA